MKKEMVMDLVGVVLFLLLFVAGGILMSMRVEQVNATSVVCS